MSLQNNDKNNLSETMWGAVYEINFFLKKDDSLIWDHKLIIQRITTLLEA